MKLLTARTTNGTDGAKTFNPFQKASPAGAARYAMSAVLTPLGVFDGANITVSYSVDQGATWNDLALASTMTTLDPKVIHAIPGWQFKATVESAGSSTSLTLHLE